MPKQFRNNQQNSEEAINKFWEFKNSADDENIGELYLYGSLANRTWWDDEVTPKQFNKDLDDLGAKDELQIRMNSYGGDVFAGHAIYNSIKNYKRKHKATIKIFIDGIAASAASVVAMAGDKIIMPSNSMMMIHDPMIGLCQYLNVADMKQYINELEKVKISIVNAYHEKTNIDKEEIAKAMEDTTWMNADEAIEAGYADVLDDETELDVQMSAENHLVVNGLDIDCSYFNDMPKQFINMANKPNKKTVETPENISEEELVNVKDLQNKHPELYDEVIKNAVEAERERVQGIQNLAAPGQEDLVNKALFEEPMNVGEFAIAQTEVQNAARKTKLKSINNDANLLDDVAPADDGQTASEEEEKQLVNELADLM